MNGAASMDKALSNDDRDPRTHSVIGAAIEVQRVLGSGFLEPVYQHALALEFVERGVPFRDQFELPVIYKGTKLACTYRADFICFNEIIVEIKALSQLGSVESAQVLNYLKVTGYPIGLLINFGAPRLELKRFILADDSRRHASARDEIDSHFQDHL
jgi:GxxExxY protein